MVHVHDKITWLSWNEAGQYGKACRKIQILVFLKFSDFKFYHMTKYQR